MIRLSLKATGDDKDTVALIILQKAIMDDEEVWRICDKNSKIETVSIEEAKRMFHDAIDEVL